MSDADKAVLIKYDIDYKEFQVTTDQIEGSVLFKPFELKQPFIRWFGFRLIYLLLFLIYVYTALILMQLALFNLIIVGVAVVYMTRWITFLYALEHRQDYNYRTRPFKRFIESENERYFRKEKCELIGGEMGRWIEL